MTSFTPLAQTFFVNAEETPDGVFLAAVDLCFSYKDDSLPVTVCICPTTNGFPDTSKIFKGSEVVVYPEDINTTTGTESDIPDLTDADTRTRFLFEYPVYVPPGQHAIVIKTGSSKYVIYVARLRELTLGDERLVSQQPYVGTLYKGQNSGMWLAEETEDLMFNLVRARFNIDQPLTVEYTNVAYESNSVSSSANSYFHFFHCHENHSHFGRGRIRHHYRHRIRSSGAMQGGNTSFQVHQDVRVSDVGVVLPNTNGSLDRK